MRTARHFAAAVVALLVAFAPALAAARTIRLAPGASLEAALRQAAARPGTIIELAPGDYSLSPEPYTDPTCGNCQDPAESVPATLGVRVSGERVQIRGPGAA